MFRHAARTLAVRRASRTGSPRMIRVAVVGVMAGMCVVWLWPQAPSSVFRPIPTGVSFNVSVMQSASEGRAHAVAGGLAASGMPAFTRSLRNGDSHQVVVGPYVTLDEAEAAQRLVAAHGLRGRVLVDESVRRVAGHDGASQVSAGANVLLIAGAGRVAIVIELPSEPRQVVTRRVGERGLEIEAGPMPAAIGFQRWNAPAGVALLQRVSVDQSGTGESRGIRTRIAMSESASASVRMAGRRVYIDLSPLAGREGPPNGTLPSDEAGREGLPGILVSGEPGRKGPPYVMLASAGRTLTARQTGGNGPLSLAPAVQDYRVTIRPAVAKFDAIEPFVLSAVGSPAPEVLSALRQSLQALDQWMRNVRPPRQWQDAHYSLVSAISLTAEALSPEFTGDRTARARLAFARRDSAKMALNSGRPAIN